MTVVDWDDSYSVGHEEIDGDHKRIIALLNELHDAYAAGVTPQEARRLFVDLEETVAHHFAREEAILSACGYQNLEAQHVEHRLLRDSLANVGRHLQKVGSERSVAAAEVRDFLLGWFMSHVLDEDMQFRDALRGRHSDS